MGANVRMVQLPPGFRFYPTDEELVAYYLHRKAAGMKIPGNVIAEIDLYKHDPWELPGLSGSCSCSAASAAAACRETQWFFFNMSDKKYPRGSRTNRATLSGYWKATGRDRKVAAHKLSALHLSASKKTLVFYRGRAPHGQRTDWVMHEYQLLHEPPSSPSPSSGLDLISKHPMVVCRIMKKRSSLAPPAASSTNPEDDPQPLEDNVDDEEQQPPTIHPYL